MPVEPRREEPGLQKHSSNNALSLVVVTAAIAYLIYGVLSYALAGKPIEMGAFSLLNLWRIPSFYDLHWNLVVTSCNIPFDELATKDIKCQGFPWVGYPPLSLILGKHLGLGVKDRGWLATLTSLALIATITHQSWLASKTARAWALVTTLLLLSFPTQILIERNNLDAVIYVLLALFCLTIWLPRRLLAAPAVGGLLTAFKIYPFFGIIAWAITCSWNADLRKKLPWLGLLLLLTQVALLVVVLATLKSKMLIKAGQLGSHGLFALGYLNNPIIAELGVSKARIIIKLLFGAKALSLLSGFLGSLFMIKPQTLSVVTNHQTTPLARGYNYSTLIVMTATGVGCYMTTINYDYRLVFLLPLISLVAATLWGGNPLERGQKVLLHFFLAAAFYVFYLPLLLGLAESWFLGLGNQPTSFNLEVFDEMVAAPFLFGSSSALLLLLFTNSSVFKLQAGETQSGHSF